MSFESVAKISPMQTAGQAMLARFEFLSADHLEAKPSPAAWSRHEVVQHMMMAYRGTVAGLERQIARGSATSRPRTLKERVGQFMLVRCGYFPPGRKAPAMVDPAKIPLPAVSGTVLAVEYRTALQQLDHAIAQAEAAFGTRVPLANHPVLGPLSGPQWRRFHAVHTLHHCRQMDRIGVAVQT